MYNYYAFGMPKYGDEQWYDAGDQPASMSTDYAYRFGFNGQEKDDEVKGVGNSLDFGARIYDSRLGRWLSLDPLQRKYPGLSAYQYANNNPVYFIDIEGKYFTGGPEELLKLQRIYQALIRKADEGDEVAQSIKAKLEAMDQSEVEYHITTANDAREIPEDSGGETKFAVKENRVVMKIASDDLAGNSVFNDNYFGRLGHELGHGYQFENSELGFEINQKSKVVHPMSETLDKVDEDNAIDMGTYLNNLLFEDGFDANGKPKFKKTTEQAQDQKDQYKNYPPESRNVPEGQVNSQNSDQFKAKSNYVPNEKQKSERRAILGVKK